MVKCDVPEKVPWLSSWCGVTRLDHFSGPAALLMVSLTEASLPSAAKPNKDSVPQESAASAWRIWWIIWSQWPWPIRPLYQLSVRDNYVVGKQLKHFEEEFKARDGTGQTLTQTEDGMETFNPPFSSTLSFVPEQPSTTPGRSSSRSLSPADLLLFLSTCCESSEGRFAHFLT